MVTHIRYLYVMIRCYTLLLAFDVRSAMWQERLTSHAIKESNRSQKNRGGCTQFYKLERKQGERTLKWKRIKPCLRWAPLSTERRRAVTLDGGHCHSEGSGRGWLVDSAKEWTDRTGSRIIPGQSLTPLIHECTHVYICRHAQTRIYRTDTSTFTNMRTHHTCHHWAVTILLLATWLSHKQSHTNSLFNCTKTRRENGRTQRHW